MFRKSLIPLALLCAVAILTASLAAQADRNPSATGGGWFFGLAGETKFSFNAVQIDDGTVVGHARFDYPEMDFRVQVDIDCINFHDPRRATLSGIITTPGLEGTRIAFRVHDESADGEKGLDNVSDWLADYLQGQIGDCDDPVTSEQLPVVRGNIQVQGE